MNDDTSTTRPPEVPPVATVDATHAAVAGRDRRRRTRRKPARMTPAKLHAQRANARLSTGPQTLYGSRRAAVNRLRSPLEPWMRSQVKLPVRDYVELQRIWRELAAIFWFLDPVERYFTLYLAAWRWWRKLNALRAAPVGGRFQADLEELNSDLDACLAMLISRYARHTQQWDRRILKELGKDALKSTAVLRLAVEARLDEFRDRGLPIPRRLRLLKKPLGTRGWERGHPARFGSPKKTREAWATRGSEPGGEDARGSEPGGQDARAPSQAPAQPSLKEFLVEQGRRYLAAIEGIEPGDPTIAARLTSLAAEERASGRLAEIDPWLAGERRLGRKTIRSHAKMGLHPPKFPGGNIGANVAASD